jgi:hypothetical protein
LASFAPLRETSDSRKAREMAMSANGLVAAMPRCALSIIVSKPPMYLRFHPVQKQYSPADVSRETYFPSGCYLKSFHSES